MDTKTHNSPSPAMPGQYNPVEQAIEAMQDARYTASSEIEDENDRVAMERDIDDALAKLRGIDKTLSVLRGKAKDGVDATPRRDALNIDPSEFGNNYPVGHDRLVLEYEDSPGVLFPLKWTKPYSTVRADWPGGCQVGGDAHAMGYRHTRATQPGDPPRYIGERQYHILAVPAPEHEIVESKGPDLDQPDFSGALQKEREYLKEQVEDAQFALDHAVEGRAKEEASKHLNQVTGRLDSFEQRFGKSQSESVGRPGFADATRAKTAEMFAAKPDRKPLRDDPPRTGGIER